MIIIHYPTAFKALDQYIDAHNERTEKSTEKLKSAVVLAAKEIIRIYGASLLKASAITTVDKKLLPALRTNNVQLAGIVKCSIRSIQRYIVKLQTVGIIVHKKFRGSNASYDLWINPDLLFTKQEVDINNQKKMSLYTPENSSKTGLEPSDNSKLAPYIFAGYINNIIIDVDKSPSAVLSTPTEGLHAGYSVRGTHWERSPGACLDEKVNVGTDNIKTEGGRGAGAKNEVSLTGKEVGDGQNIGDDREGAPADPARADSLRFYTDMLWTLARNTIYRDIYVSSHQEAIARKHLQQYYQSVPTAKLPRIHEIYIERVTLVNRYLKKDPENRYVQLPHRYFDINNTAGFVGTKKWWLLYNERKKEIQKKLILHTQIRKYVNNQKAETAKRRPVLQVYQECEQRIGKLQDPLLLQEFQALILQPQVYAQLRSKTKSNRDETTL